MKIAQKTSDELVDLNLEISSDRLPSNSQNALTKITVIFQQLTSQKLTFKKLRGLLFVVIGYLLSPLCWWNDLFFNLPVAYGFGYICSWFSPDLLIPCSIIGYWLSNIVGILLMQFGAGDVLQAQQQERNLKKELLASIATSTAFTLIILVLMQFKILDNPILPI